MIICMKDGGKIINEVFASLKSECVSGVSTGHLNARCKELLRKNKVVSGTKDFHNFPKEICISVNEEILFGVPNYDKIVKDGDIVSFDLTINNGGYYVDKAITFGVGNISSEQNYVINATRSALNNVQRLAKAGLKYSALGCIIERTAQAFMVKPIKQFGGHGIGILPHLKPFIPNFCFKGEDVLYQGSAFTVEPIFVYYTTNITRSSNNFTWVGDLVSAHFEDTFFITDTGVEVVT